MKEIYKILAGALGHEQRLAQTANNLANVNTVGFKRDGLAFVDYLAMAQAATGADGPVNQAANSAHPVWPLAGAPYMDLAAGPLQITGKSLDVALIGQGYFTVEAPNEDEPLLTRAGNFQVTANGRLVTSDGWAVLDESGRPLELPPNGDPPVITQEGEVRVGDAVVGRLGIVNVEHPEKLEKYGHGLLRAPQDNQPQPVETPLVRQGALEGSNVNAIDEMVRMIQLERSYQAQQKVIQTVDEVMVRRIESASQ